MNMALWAPVIVLASVFVIYCWADIWRRSSVKLLPKWAWAIVCGITVPLGGIAYMLFGRED